MVTSPAERPSGRRRFLHAAFQSAAAAALFPGCMTRQLKYGGDIHMKRRMESVWEGPGPLPPTGIFPDMPRAVVSVVEVRESVYAAVREAVEAAGGLDEIEPGQRVMIKPNLSAPNPPGEESGRICTNPEVVRAVIRLVKERGATPMVGDRGMIFTDYTFRHDGFERVCQEEGAVPYPWTLSEYVKFHPGRRHWSRGFHMPAILKEVDHFINVPVLKTHQWFGANFTCCLKAFVGVCMPLDRWQEGPDALHAPNISEKVAELNLCAAPTINIVDATECIVQGGPDGYPIQLYEDGMKKKAVSCIWVRPNLILASRDRVACDSVGLLILKTWAAEERVDHPYVTRSVWDQAQIYYSAELGIGQADPQMISIEDINVGRMDEYKSNWK